MTFASGPQPRSWSGPQQQAQQPPRPAYQMATPPGPPLVLDLHRANARKLVIAWVLYIPIVLSALICGVAEVVNGRTQAGGIALAVGGALLALGLVGLFVRRRTQLPRRLVIEPAGIRWDDRQGRARMVGWPELAAVGLIRHERPRNASPTLGQVVVDGSLGRPVLVHLELYPVDPGFRQRRTDLAHLWHGDRLRMQLGFNAHQLPQLDAALGYFLPGRYRGIQQTLANGRFR